MRQGRTRPDIHGAPARPSLITRPFCDGSGLGMTLNVAPVNNTEDASEADVSKPFDPNFYPEWEREMDKKLYARLDAKDPQLDRAVGRLERYPR